MLRKDVITVKTVALTGKSGTGKSYRSIWLAAEKNLEYIIDDGILIYHNKIVEGVSAKRAKTKIGAVKRAIFDDEVLRRKMASAIRRSNPQGILVIATSEKMAELIRTRLELPPYDEIVHIEDIATSEEIKRARLMREGQGKHVIPVPVMEIKKTFSGYFLDPLSVFRRPNRSPESAQSIVRPSYSYMGDFEINDTVLARIAQIEMEKTDGIAKVLKTSVEKTDGGAVIFAEVAVYYGVLIPRCVNSAANAVKTALERYAAIYTDAVNITVKTLVM